METKTLGYGVGIVGSLLVGYGLYKKYGGDGENGEDDLVRVSLDWDDGVVGQTFALGSIHQANLLIENPTSEEMIYHAYLGSLAWANLPYWFIIWDPLPTPHYPLIIEPGGAILWEHDITLSGDLGAHEVGIQVLSGLDPDLKTLIQWKVLDTINLVAA